MGANHLYRHFDSNDKLLYVGVSLNAINRLSQHRDVSEWFTDIAKVTIEQFPNRQEVLDAETKAIQNENPKYNIQKRKKEKEPVQEEKKTPAESARLNLIRRVVDVNPVYCVRGAAHFLGMRPIDFEKLIDTGKIKAIELPYQHSNRRYVTGFQLIDFLENI